MRDYRAYRLDLTGRIVGRVGDNLTEYRVYLLGSDGHIIKRIEMAFQDDATAITAIRQRFAGLPFEVWDGARLVHASTKDIRNRAEEPPT